MVIELHLRLSKETETGLHNFFFQLAASVPVPLPLGAGRAAALRALSLPSTSWFFSGTFCWPSVTHVSSLGPDSPITSSTNRPDKICLLSTKYCH